MHIILGILGPVITILILLNRLAEAGIDIGGLNPFLWHRRRKWRKKYTGNPLFQIDSPMDAAGILLVGAAKADGDISIEEKKHIQEIFETEFHLNAKDAAGLFISSVHLIGDGNELRNNLSRFIKPSKEKFNDHQIKSTLDVLARISSLGGSVHPNVSEYIADIEKHLQPAISKQQESW